jgi:hypothetical protein
MHNKVKNHARNFFVLVQGHKEIQHADKAHIGSVFKSGIGWGLFPDVTKI